MGAASAGRLPLHKFFEEELSEALAIMPDDAVLFEKVIKDAAEPHLLEFFRVRLDGFGAVGAVTAGNGWRDRLMIDHHPIEHAPPCMPLNRANVVGNRIA